MAHPEDWHAQEQLSGFSLESMQTSFVARMIVKDMCDTPLNEEDTGMLTEAMTVSAKTGLHAVAIAPPELLESAITITSLVDGIDEADAFRTLTRGLTSGFAHIRWDPESIELKAAFITPKAMAVQALGPTADLTRSDYVQDYPVEHVEALNFAGDAFVQMSVGELYAIARDSYFQ